MTTEYLHAAAPEAIQRAAALLRAGELVAFPTETVYGLGAIVWNSEAVGKVFQAKGRPSDNPLIVHIAAVEDVRRVAVAIPPLFYVLAEHFFPGPLTVVLDKHPSVPSVVAGGLATVAVRMPAHDTALALIQAAGEPLVAPSANRSGLPSPTTAQHVLDDLDTRIAAVLDGGACSIGIESTVVSLRGGGTLSILRPGSIAKEQIEEVTGQEVTYAEMHEGEVPAAPGMKYRHYAPQARIALANTLQEVHQILKTQQGKTRVLASEPIEGIADIRTLHTSTLYAEFRQADTDGIQVLVLLCNSDVRNNRGLMNRIVKAAEG